MPSPIAHLAVGYAVSRRAAAGLAACLFLSVLPDVDFIPGFLFHDLSAWHNNVSHSLAAGLLVSALAGALGGLVGGKPAGLRWFRWSLILYGLHLLMDFMTVGRGIMLFWPFLQARFCCPFPIFFGARWNEGWFSIQHVWTFLNEIGFILVLWLLHRLQLARRTSPAGDRGVRA